MCANSILPFEEKVTLDFLLAVQLHFTIGHRFYDDGDFLIGSGFTQRPTPPTSMLFPYRKYSLWLLLCGFLLYAFLPLRKSHPDEIRYPRWRMVLGDIVALLLSVPFFAFPFFITGGTLQAFYNVPACQDTKLKNLSYILLPFLSAYAAIRYC